MLQFPELQLKCLKLCFSTYHESFGHRVNDSFVNQTVASSGSVLLGGASPIWVAWYRWCDDGRYVPHSNVDSKAICCEDFAHPNKAIKSLSSEKVTTSGNDDRRAVGTDLAIGFHLEQIHSRLPLTGADMTVVYWANLAIDCWTLMSAWQLFKAPLAAG